MVLHKPTNEACIIPIMFSCSVQTIKTLFTLETIAELHYL
jgi:hypothetical protein